MEPNIFPTEAYCSSKLMAHSFEMYKQSSAVSIQCCVSNCSPSASVNLLAKCFSYFLLAHASAICAPTERDDRLTWSVSEYISSFGNFLEISNISFDNLRESLYTSNSLKLFTYSIFASFTDYRPPQYLSVLNLISEEETLPNKSVAVMVMVYDLFFANPFICEM